jgi:O-antigen ligase
VTRLRLLPRPATGPAEQEKAVGELVAAGAVPGRMLLVWGALFLNVLTFADFPRVHPLPVVFGQMITASALPLALVLALAVNRRIVLRPSLLLVLLSLLAMAALMVSIHSEYPLGSAYRALRMLGFVAVLWLLTPWWGRSDMLLLRCHRICLWAVLATVVVGAAIAPGMAFEFEGRLSGILWPVPPTQVGHYAAVLFGTTAVLWLCRVISGRHALLALSVTGLVLVGTHTRTALLAMTLGLVVATASLFLGHVRVRRASAIGALAAVGVGTLFASQLAGWVLRGQTAEEAGQLTGRTNVWEQVLSAPRPRINEWFGTGLSDQSFNGLPIDSNWVATYWEQGWFGVTAHITILVLLLLMAVRHRPGPQRACALFLVVYCLVASFTETGMALPTPYLLELVLAAALLAPAARETARGRA